MEENGEVLEQVNANHAKMKTPYGILSMRGKWQKKNFLFNSNIKKIGPVDYGLATGKVTILPNYGERKFKRK